MIYSSSTTLSSNFYFSICLTSWNQSTNSRSIYLDRWLPLFLVIGNIYEIKLTLDLIRSRHRFRVHRVCGVIGILTAAQTRSTNCSVHFSAKVRVNCQSKGVGGGVVHPRNNCPWITTQSTHCRSLIAIVAVNSIVSWERRTICGFSWVHERSCPTKYSLFLHSDLSLKCLIENNRFHRVQHNKFEQSIRAMPRIQTDD